jgi:hypothetical protein
LHDRLSSGTKYIDLLRGLARIDRTGIQPFYPYASGKIVAIDGISLQILHPTRADCSDALAMANRNDISVVLRIEYAGRRILLGADVQGQGWSWIANRYTDLQADIFKFPHHGAWYDRGMLIPELLDRIRPSYVIISVGTGNNYNHPSEKIFAKLRTHHATLRFLCTQATSQCHSNFNCIRKRIFSILSPNSQISFSRHDEKSCPCAGTIFAQIGNSGIVITPTIEEHKLIITNFDTPQCRP